MAEKSTRKSALLETQWLENPQSIKVANDQLISVSLGATGTLLLQRHSSSCNVVFPNHIRQKGARLGVTAKVMPSMMENVDLIVGMDHLEAFGAVLDCKNGTVKMTDPRLAQEFRPKERLPPGKVNPHNVVSAMLTLQKAAPTEFLSPHQTAKSIRQGDSSWLMLVHSVAETQDVVATCAEASILESAPRLLSHQAIGKVTEEFKDVFEPITECPPHRFEVDHTIKLVDGSNSNLP